MRNIQIIEINFLTNRITVTTEDDSQNIPGYFIEEVEFKELGAIFGEMYRNTGGMSITNDEFRIIVSIPPPPPE